MATLVLTAVGTAIGGPIGGAIGALIGQGVDGRLFRPAARQGPRLTELAVQTSSYGSQIPRLFGTIRVAGTVIWASDLIERRATSGGGKGQPSTTSYSYAASFAVLLSARRIVGIGRIWAEGKLLRGAAGDWKASTGFRLHLGGEDQAVDPLIASAETIAPAHRGCAYAVFEDLQLADYGNRIPSLTFEVIADAGDIGVGAIATALAAEVDAAVAMTVTGFAAAGESVGGVLDALATMSGGWWGGATRPVLRDTVDGSMRIADAGVTAAGTDRPGGRGVRAVAAADQVARAMVVSHYDPARDYQLGVQRAVRPGAGYREERIELPAVIAAGAAKTIAAGLIERAEAERVRRTVTVGPEAIGLAPGAGVAIAGESGGWRVVRASVVGMATQLELVPVAATTLAVRATSGRVAAAVDAPAGATLLRVFETPPLDDAPADAPRLTVVATGEGAGWRRAALLYSLDDGASWTAAGATAAPGVIGVIDAAGDALGGAPATLEDRRHRLVVRLARGDMDLHDADAVALDGGANLALVGDELIQFAAAAPLGDGRWALTGLRRGRRGTEAAIGSQMAGDRFVLIEPAAARVLTMPAGTIGRTVRVLASGVGDDAGPATAAAVLTGASILPPSPVRLRVEPAPDGGLEARWTRRSRRGWRWTDGIDAPLGEEAEAYRVVIDGVASEAGMPRLALPDGARRIEVRQRGTWGLSPPATLDLGQGDDR